MTERELLAAELALRLLDGEELLAARGLLASDPAFADEVTAWEERFAPLFDAIDAQTPPDHAWGAIVHRLDGAGDNVVALKRRLTRWRIGAGAAAIAAALLLALQLQPAPVVPAPPGPIASEPAPLLMASLVGEEGPEALTVVYRPDSRELVISPARMPMPKGRARELWLIPAGAAPISLGLVAADGVQRRPVVTDLAARFAAGATIALSDEPSGGSPTGQPTGAVLAAGNLTTV